MVWTHREVHKSDSVRKQLRSGPMVRNGSSDVELV